MRSRSFTSDKIVHEASGHSRQVVGRVVLLYCKAPTWKISAQNHSDSIGIFAKWGIHINVNVSRTCQVGHNVPHNNRCSRIEYNSQDESHIYYRVI